MEDMKTVYLEQLRMLAFNMPNGPWQRTWVRQPKAHNGRDSHMGFNQQRTGGRFVRRGA